MARQKQGRWERRWELWGLWILLFVLEIGWILAFQSLRGVSAFGAERARTVQPEVPFSVQSAGEGQGWASRDYPPPPGLPVESTETEAAGAVEDAGVVRRSPPEEGEAGEDDEELSAEEGPDEADRKVSLSYFGIFYGPGFEDPGPYQPRVGGGQDRNRPVQLKSFMTLGYQANNEIGLAGTAYWTYQPGLSEKLLIQDPFVRVSHNALMNTENFNWYGDFRVHFGVSDLSRQSDLLTSLQTFHAFTWVPGAGSFAASLYGSFRYNVFGDKGIGSDIELYLAPYVQYDLSESLAVTLMYELGASHAYGTRAANFVSDGADLEPGILWQITPNLAVNPYLNLYPSDGFSLNTASFGVSLGWKLL